MKYRSTFAMISFVALTILPAATFGQNEAFIGLYSNESGTDCHIVSPEGVGLVFVYVVFVADAQTTLGVKFRAAIPDCWTNAVWVGDNVTSSIVGFGDDSQVGISLPFAGFTEGLVMSIGVFVSGAETNCCPYVFTPSTVIFGSVNCFDFVCRFVSTASNVPIPLATRDAVINADQSCSCMLPVAVEDTSWGQIKSLYR